MKRGAAGNPVTMNCPDRLCKVWSACAVDNNSANANAKVECLIFATGFRRRLALRLLWLALGCAGRLGVTAGCARFFLGRFLVFVATIIRDVKTAALEDQAGAATNDLPYAPLAPFFHAALLLWANYQRLVCHRLKQVEPMIALFTIIF